MSIGGKLLPSRHYIRGGENPGERGEVNEKATRIFALESIRKTCM